MEPSQIDSLVRVIKRLTVAVWVPTDTPPEGTHGRKGDRVI